jgi:hypothetical protein
MSQKKPREDSPTEGEDEGFGPTEECQECGDPGVEYRDPRDPPIVEEECLCLDCYVNACLENYDDLTEQVNDALLELRAAENIQKARDRKLKKQRMKKK